jgi:hypothetical protein
MAVARAQLEELEKPDPRHVLELNSIRGMIQEANNTDKRLKMALGIRMQGVMHSGGIPSAPQGTPPPASTISTALFASPIDPPLPAAVSRPPHAPPLQPAHRKKSPQTQAPEAALSSAVPPHISTTSTPPRAKTPGTTASSPQTPKSFKGKAAAKPKFAPRRQVSMKTKTDSLETPAPASAVSSTPTSSTPADAAKGSSKRVREDGTDAPTSEVPSTPSPKRVKPESPNEETWTRDEHSEDVKTDEQALSLFERVTKFIDEAPEFDEAASNSLDEILRDIDTIAPSSSILGDLPPVSPQLQINSFEEFIDYSALDDAPTPDLIASSSVNPSPESVSDQDHLQSGRACSPQMFNVEAGDAYELLRPTVLKDIAGGDTMFHQAQGWKWEGELETEDSDQEWTISTS